MPGGAGISIPLWFVDAPVVGAILFPKPELIRLYPGIGHKKSSDFVVICTSFTTFSTGVILSISVVNIEKQDINIVEKLRSKKDLKKLLFIENSFQENIAPNLIIF